MNDLTNRKGAINAVCTVLYPDADKMHDAKKVLKEMPSAQPEPSQVARDIADIIENEKDMRVIARSEIIRCKDCKYSSPNRVYGCILDRFSYHDYNERMYSEDYCSRAERREDGNK